MMCIWGWRGRGGQREFCNAVFGGQSAGKGPTIPLLLTLKKRCGKQIPIVLVNLLCINYLYTTVKALLKGKCSKTPVMETFR